MKDLFYIVEVKPQWYNLIVKDTQYCLGCGDDLEPLKRTIYNYVRKYKTKERVLDVLSKMTDLGKVSPATFAQRQQAYEEGGHEVFDSLVLEVVERALKDNRQDTPYNHTKGKVKIVPTTTVRERSLPPVNTTPTKVVKVIRPRKITRTKSVVD